jgi:hypothetical protein
MSHHYRGPNIGFPRGDARLDLTDLYAFAKPGDPGKSSLSIKNELCYSSTGGGNLALAKWLA